MWIIQKKALALHNLFNEMFYVGDVQKQHRVQTLLHSEKNTPKTRLFKILQGMDLYNINALKCFKKPFL